MTMNFGVREVPLATAPQGPGWAYVPDTGINASVAALQPAARKRLRTELTSNHETSAKQDAKILRDILALDRENHRDVSIPIPPRPRDNLGRASQAKTTSTVRKILFSQKTFANHLADFEALPPQPVSSQAATPLSRASPSLAPPPLLTSTLRRSHKKKEPAELLHRSSSATTPTLVKVEPVDTHLPDAPVLSMGTSKYPPSHPRDDDTLLVSRIPALPSPEELQKLLDTPPLSYNEARGPWIEEDRRKPVRRFCEVCGYWGRVKCTRCGGRVCALECLNVHQEDCFTRYGA